MEGVQNAFPKPWLNEDGSEKTDEELKKISVHWSPETWERYLLSKETYLREQIFEENIDIDQIHAEKYSDTLVYLSETKQYDAVRKRLERALKKLSNLQREVIFRTYWAGQSQRQIAEEMGKAKTTICVAHKRAIAQLKEIFQDETIITKFKQFKDLRTLRGDHLATTNT